MTADFGEGLSGGCLFRHFYEIISHLMAETISLPLPQNGLLEWALATCCSANFGFHHTIIHLKV
jgi:hypothetical protein